MTPTTPAAAMPITTMNMICSSSVSPRWRMLLCAAHIAGLGLDDDLAREIAAFGAADRDGRPGARSPERVEGDGRGGRGNRGHAIRAAGAQPIGIVEAVLRHPRRAIEVQRGLHAIRRRCGATR